MAKNLQTSLVGRWVVRHELGGTSKVARIVTTWVAEGRPGGAELWHQGECADGTVMNFMLMGGGHWKLLPVVVSEWPEKLQRFWKSAE